MHQLRHAALFPRAMLLGRLDKQLHHSPLTYLTYLTLRTHVLFFLLFSRNSASASLDGLVIWIYPCPPVRCRTERYSQQPIERRSNDHPSAQKEA